MKYNIRKIYYNKIVNKRASTILLIIIVFFPNIFGCKSNAPTESPTQSYINVPGDYMSLSVGDLREYYMPYSSADTIYSVWKVAGITYRTDGTPVFISKWYILNYYDQNESTEYNFIRDGYFYSTKLNSSSTYPGNPYSEQKLAELKPQNGDSWLQTVGEYNPDSSRDYFITRYLGNFKVPAGIFKNVFNFTSYQNTPGSDSAYIYYAPYFGHIGIQFSSHDTTSSLVLNYADIGGKAVGKYVKLDTVNSVPKPGALARLNKLLNLLGVKNK